MELLVFEVQLRFPDKTMTINYQAMQLMKRGCPVGLTSCLFRTNAAAAAAAAVHSVTMTTINDAITVLLPPVLKLILSSLYMLLLLLIVFQ